MFFNMNKRKIRKMKPLVKKVLELEPVMAKLSDAKLQQKTAEFKKRLAAGATLDQILPEAFAVCREGAWRVLKMKHFPVQIMGGIALHQGKVAEMYTGEGKTLVATMPAYLNALLGRGVHIVTVNEYLAKRDSEWMGQLYKFLGLSVGLIYSGQSVAEKKAAYASDIVYGTNSEFGFDYLRQHMVYRAEDKVQRELYLALIDEVDSVLIDEARTPLIITSEKFRSSDLYVKANQFILSLTKNDYLHEEKEGAVALTEEGVTKAEKFFGVNNLSDLENLNLNHHIQVALRAHFVAKRDKDYIVDNGKILLIDPFTGRIAKGKVYSNGVHQAIEAKEGLDITPENAVDATITYQNFFKMYERLGGMTGTALTEAEEFQLIYGLDVVTIPPNRPVIRQDHPDSVYVTEKAKYKAVIDEIKVLHARRQPVLVGTADVEKSEKLSSLLKKEGIPHQVLNAKFHEQEAQIIAQAGRLGAVTIATNMAGRGTDILLGGNPTDLANAFFAKENSGLTLEQLLAHPEVPEENKEKLQTYWQAIYEKCLEITTKEREEVVALGGLFVIGTERHEARRIDNQLRGRAGRQGDPGASRFYLSLEDDLLRIFGGKRVQMLAENLKMNEAMPIASKMISAIIEKAQKNLEQYNFQLRKNLLQFDRVVNIQRTLIYTDRDKVLFADKEKLLAIVQDMIDQRLAHLLQTYCHARFPAEWHLKELCAEFTSTFGLPLTLAASEDLTLADVEDEMRSVITGAFDKIPALDNAEAVRRMLLETVDTLWKEHIDILAQIKQGIGLQGLGGKDPVREFELESHRMYENLLSQIGHDFIKRVFTVSTEPIVESETLDS